MAKSIQERMEIAKDLIQYGFLMTKPLKAGTLRNKVFGKSCTGYTFEIDNLSYRGIWVSTIEDIKITVDGESIPKNDILFCLKGIKIPVDDLGGHTEIFWGARDACAISVNKVGGIKQGSHKFEIVIRRRNDFGHSYGEAEQGYDQATEFLNPAIIKDEIVYTI